MFEGTRIKVQAILFAAVKLAQEALQGFND